MCVNAVESENQYWINLKALLLESVSVGEYDTVNPAQAVMVRKALILYMYWLEVEIFKGEMSFHDASGLHTCTQHILLGGDVVLLTDPFQVIQVAAKYKTGEYEVTSYLIRTRQASFYLEQQLLQHRQLPVPVSHETIWPISWSRGFSDTDLQHNAKQHYFFFHTLAWWSGGLPLKTQGDTKYGLIFWYMINTGSLWVE